MDPLAHTFALARDIRTALGQAVEVAERMGPAMRGLEADALFEVATRRQHLNEGVARLTGEMATSLAAVASARNWQEVTVADLRSLDALGTADFECNLAAIRELAGRLRELDKQNQVRGGRTVAFLRGVVAGHELRPSAYDRRGAPTVTSGRPLSTGSRTA